MASELSSWKEISSYLGVGVRTAQVWERDRGLPVRRLPGGRGGVWALVAELDGWKLQHPSAGTEPEVPATTRIPATAAGPRGLLRLRLWRFSAAAFVFVAALGVWAVGFANRRPFSVVVTQNGFSVLDDGGREVWRQASLSPLQLDWYDPSEQRGLSQVVDLDGDGSPEVLFSPQVAVVRDGVLLCLDARGRERWRFIPGKDVRNGHGESFAPPYGVSSVLVLPPVNGRRRTVVVGIHHLSFATQVSLLDDRGRLLREYWHSGHLHRSALHTVNGRSVVLLGGISNATKEATLVALDPETMSGASQDVNANYQLAGFSRGTEVARFLFPRTCVNRAFDPMNTVGRLYVTPDEIVVTVREREGVPRYPEIQYHFTTDLAFRRTDASSQFESQHEQLANNGTLDHHLNKTEIASLRPTVR